MSQRIQLGPMVKSRIANELTLLMAGEVELRDAYAHILQAVEACQLQADFEREDKPIRFSATLPELPEDLKELARKPL